jgi:hypothetical protein
LCSFHSLRSLARLDNFAGGAASALEQADTGEPYYPRNPLTCQLLKLTLLTGLHSHVDRFVHALRLSEEAQDLVCSHLLTFSNTGERVHLLSLQDDS